MTKDEVREEALSVLRKWKRCGVGLSMGMGKTRLGLEHFQLVINKIYKTENRDAKCLIVAPTLKILKSWKSEAIKWNMNNLIEHMSFSTYRSLSKQDLSKYDVIYLDECHSLKYPHDKVLRKFQGYIIGLTGTPPKYSNSENGIMLNNYCPIRYEYLVKSAVEDGLLNDYEIRVHLLSLGTMKNHKINIKKNNKIVKTWLSSEQGNYEYLKDKLDSAENSIIKKKYSILVMRALQSYKTKEYYAKQLLNETKQKCILFANTQEQADLLCKHSYHSSNPKSSENLKLFEENKITKLSCVSQLSEGANIKNLYHIIILHAFGNNRSSSQRIGRGLRLDPSEKAYIDILCYKNTIDEIWVKEALHDLDPNKIIWYDTETD